LDADYPATGSILHTCSHIWNTDENVSAAVLTGNPARSGLRGASAPASRLGHWHPAHSGATNNAWNAAHGPEQEVIFRSVHTSGKMGLPDFTAMGKLGVTTAFNGCVRPADDHPRRCLGEGKTRSSTWSRADFVSGSLGTTADFLDVWHSAEVTAASEHTLHGAPRFVIRKVFEH